MRPMIDPLMHVIALLERMHDIDAEAKDTILAAATRAVRDSQRRTRDRVGAQRPCSACAHKVGGNVQNPFDSMCGRWEEVAQGTLCLAERSSGECGPEGRHWVARTKGLLPPEQKENPADHSGIEQQ